MNGCVVKEKLYGVDRGVPSLALTPVEIDTEYVVVALSPFNVWKLNPDSLTERFPVVAGMIVSEDLTVPVSTMPLKIALIDELRLTLEVLFGGEADMT